MSELKIFLRMPALLLAAALVVDGTAAQEPEAPPQPAAAEEARETEDPMTLDGLLEAVRSGRLAENKANERRLTEFRQ